MSFERPQRPWSEPGPYLPPPQDRRPRFVRPMTSRQFGSAVVFWTIVALAAVLWTLSGIERCIAIFSDFAHAAPTPFFWAATAVLAGPAIAYLACKLIGRVARNWWAFEGDAAEVIYGRRRR